MLDNIKKDLRVRYALLSSLIKSIDFFISLIIILLLAITLYYSSLPLIYVSPLILLTLIITYDFFLSFSIFNIHVFSIKNSSSEYISEVITAYILSGVNLSDKNILNIIRSEIEDKLNSYLQRIIKIPRIRKILIRINLYFVDFFRNIVKIVYLFVFINKDFNSFHHKIIRLIYFLFIKTYYLLVILFKIIVKIVTTIMYAVPVVIASLIYIYFLMESAIKKGEFITSDSVLYAMGDFIIESQWLLKSIDVIAYVFFGYLLLKFIYLVSKELGGIVKSLKIFLALLLVPFLLFLLKSLFVFLSKFVNLFSKDVTNLLYSFSGFTENTSEKISMYIVAVLLLSLFYVLRSQRGFLQVFSYIYIFIMTGTLMMLANTSMFIFVSLLFIWSLGKRLETNLFFSLIFILPEYIEYLSQNSILLFQAFVVLIVVLTDYKDIPGNNGSDIIAKKDFFIKSLKGKYKTLLSDIEGVKLSY